MTTEKQKGCKPLDRNVDMKSTTLAEVLRWSDIIATSTNGLESQIWAIKAEAKAQMDKSVKTYLEAVEAREDASQPELCAKMKEAIERYEELEKLWSQALALQNRAAPFAEMKNRHAAETMKIVADAWAAQQPSAA